MQIEPTAAQLTALKNDITADQSAAFLAFKADPSNAELAQFVADIYNVNASPDFWVWRTNVSQLEIVSTTTEDATTWSWPAFIARSQGERDGWREMFADGGYVNASLANVRQGFADIFSGSTNSAPAQRTHLLAVGRRRATRVEKLLSTGTGSTASPAVMGAEGTLVYNSVQAAWFSQ